MSTFAARSAALSRSRIAALAGVALAGVALAGVALAGVALAGMSSRRATPPMRSAACCRNAPEARAIGAGKTAPLGVSHNAYGHAVANLVREHWSDVREGKAVFATTWVAPGAGAAERAARGPAARVREGLGPLFNENSCLACHFRDGRGRDPDAVRRGPRASWGPPRLVRLGRVGVGGELLAEPGYGLQLQTRAVPPVAPEGFFDIILRRVDGQYPDGAPFALEAPDVAVRGERGPLHPATRVSLRSPPSLIGLGLLEAVPEAAVVALADPDDVDGDGVSGRPNRVRDPQTGELVLGRFGWKASQPSLWLQNATALREDLGVTTPVFPRALCATGDACDAMASPPELDAAALEQLTRYTRLLGPPARRGGDDAVVARGEAVFDRIGCAACHHRRFETGEVADLPELAHQVIEPYTDLLLHDLGEPLSDHRPDGDAAGQEWRTAPLWGLGYLRAVSGDVRLLHDGRARSPEEAILWHGGEALAARDRFMASPGHDRVALLTFLDAL